MSRMLLGFFLPDALMLGGLVRTPVVRPVRRLRGVGVAGAADLMEPGFSPRWLMTFGMARPLYEAVDRSVEPHAQLQVTGGGTRGAESAYAVPLGPSVPLEIASTDVYAVYTCDVSAWLGTTEHLLPLGVTPLVTASGVDVTSALVQACDADPTMIWIALGGAAALSTYSVRLVAQSDRGAKRTIIFPPITCWDAPAAAALVTPAVAQVVAPPVTTTVPASLSPVLLLSANTKRQVATIRNNSTSGILTFTAGTDTASLNPLSVAIIEPPDLWTGIVTGVWDVADGQAEVEEVSSL